MLDISIFITMKHVLVQFDYYCNGTFSIFWLLHLTRFDGKMPKFFFLLSVSREKLKPHVGFSRVENGASLFLCSFSVPSILVSMEFSVFDLI